MQIRSQIMGWNSEYSFSACPCSLLDFPLLSFAFPFSSCFSVLEGEKGGGQRRTLVSVAICCSRRLLFSFLALFENQHNIFCLVWIIHTA